MTARLLATFFGLGLMPFMPGTWGSMGAALMWAPLAWFLPPWGFALALGASAPLWFRAAQKHLENLRSRGDSSKDPKEIVVDEALGMGLAVLWLPPDWRLWAAAFLVFRALDVSKVPPMRQLERLPGVWGVMADDAAAGVLACLAAHGLRVWLL
jgi:phosphatidylglycerophosphatase A